MTVSGITMDGISCDGKGQDNDHKRKNKAFRTIFVLSHKPGQGKDNKQNKNYNPGKAFEKKQEGRKQDNH